MSYDEIDLRIQLGDAADILYLGTFHIIFIREMIGGVAGVEGDRKTVDLGKIIDGEHMAVIGTAGLIGQENLQTHNPAAGMEDHFFLNGCQLGGNVLVDIHAGAKEELFVSVAQSPGIIRHFFGGKMGEELHDHGVVTGFGMLAVFLEDFLIHNVGMTVDFMLFLHGG